MNTWCLAKRLFKLFILSIFIMLEVYTRFLDGEMRGRRKRDFLHLLALGCAYLHLKFLKNFVDRFLTRKGVANNANSERGSKSEMARIT